MDTFMYTKFTFCLVWLLTSPVHSKSILEDQSFDAQIHCHALRREIVFPVAADATLSVRDIFSQSTTAPDVLHLRISWRGESLTLVLKETRITTPTSISEWDDGSGLTVENIDRSCTYEGHVRGQRSSYVAVTTCGGLSGMIQTNREMLYIRPTSDLINGDDDDDDDNDDNDDDDDDDDDDDGNDSNNAHIIYTCEPEETVDETQDDGEELEEHRRQRRSVSPTRYVEVQVVVDAKVSQKMGSQNKTIDYVLTLMNIANTVFQHKSLDQDIRLAVSDIVFLTSAEHHNVSSLRDPRETRNNFCKWVVEWNNRKATSYDTSMLLSGVDSGKIAGLALLGTVCRQKDNLNCFLSADRGFATGFIIAHEMGHVLGVLHDGDGNHCNGTKYETAIMYPYAHSTFNHFWWSECSKETLAVNIRSHRSTWCLNNQPDTVDDHFRLSSSGHLEGDLGRAWSLDAQCSRQFGDAYESCRRVYHIQASEDPCVNICCDMKHEPVSFRKYGHSALPGTTCGPNKVCSNWTCVDQSTVASKWSEWTSWSPCNVGCGVGIRTRNRTCILPSNRPKYQDCEGESDEWKTCVDYTCKVVEDKRAEECAKMKTNRFNWKWLPYAFTGGSCAKVTCQLFPSGKAHTWVQGLQHVPDGAPCSYIQDSSDICVKGKCTKVGCDGVLGSSAKLDMCGVCNGNGSQCNTFQGVFKDDWHPGSYVKLMIIPPGARHVRVHKESRPFSHIALTENYDWNFLLNGGPDYQHTEMFNQVHKGALFLYYHGDNGFFNISSSLSNEGHNLDAFTRNHGDTPELSEMFYTPGPIKNSLFVMVSGAIILDHYCRLHQEIGTDIQSQIGSEGHVYYCLDANGRLAKKS